MLYRLRRQDVTEGRRDAAAGGLGEREQRLREAVRRVGGLVLRDQQYRLHQDVDRAARQGSRLGPRHRSSGREQEPAGRRSLQADPTADNRQRQGHDQEQDRGDARDRRQEDDARHESVRISHMNFFDHSMTQVRFQPSDN